MGGFAAHVSAPSVSHVITSRDVTDPRCGYSDIYVNMLRVVLDYSVTASVVISKERAYSLS